MTESSPVITAQLPSDQMDGSSGVLLPNMRAKLIDPVTGNEITKYDTPGELWVCGPNVTLGYLNKDKETNETWTYDNEGRRWLRTGDEVEIRLSKRGQEHYWIVDRIKELIKVRSNVADVPDSRCGDIKSRRQNWKRCC
jgi:acyl-CoA synthetase (AMP-forming)/AMP-acid ligase II